MIGRSGALYWALQAAWAVLCGTLLWVSYRYLPGDPAAFLGSLGIYLLSQALIVVMVTSSPFDPMNERALQTLQEGVHRFMETREMPVRIVQMALAGVWIGLVAVNPIWIACAFVMARHALFKACGAATRTGLDLVGWLAWLTFLVVAFAAAALLMKEWLT